MENITKPNTLRILVPHDGSEMSDKALHEAKRFAKALNYEIQDSPECISCVRISVYTSYSGKV